MCHLSQVLIFHLIKKRNVMTALGIILPMKADWSFHARFGLVLALLALFSACSAPLAAQPTPSLPPQPTVTPMRLPMLSGCNQPGALGNDRVPTTTQGFDISFGYYLPPCYDKLPEARFPVIYLLLMPFETRLETDSLAPMALADRLIRSGKMPPAIIIEPGATIGYGYHAALAKDLIPYVDGKYRTLAAARYRGVGGISQGAGITARMVCEFPEIFGSAGLLSGGIAAGEIERFDGWVARMTAAERPRISIIVGEQDGIWALTSNFIFILNRYQVPYQLERGPGGHTWDYWSAHMESYLLWFAEAW
jgi:hypothetical protein